MGRTMLAVAVLDTTSVIHDVRKQTMIIITKCGNTDSSASCSPIQAERPDTLEASDMANPLPTIPNHSNAFKRVEMVGIEID